MRYLVEVIEAEQAHGLAAQPQSVQASASSAHRSVNVVDAGADPTGVADSTAAINQAIRRVHEAGGGLLTLAQGRSRRRQLSTRAPGSPRVLARTIC